MSCIGVSDPWYAEDNRPILAGCPAHRSGENRDVYGRGRSSRHLHKKIYDNACQQHLPTVFSYAAVFFRASHCAKQDLSLIGTTFDNTPTSILKLMVEDASAILWLPWRCMRTRVTVHEHPKGGSMTENRGPKIVPVAEHQVQPAHTHNEHSRRAICLSYNSYGK